MEQDVVAAIDALLTSEPENSPRLLGRAVGYSLYVRLDSEGNE